MKKELKDGLIKNEYGHCAYSFEDEGYVHIYNLFVKPQWRRQGKARELLSIAIDEIREAGYNGVIQIVAIPKEKEGEDFNDNNISLEKLTSFYQSLGLGVFEYYG